jgi:uncharacterized SAM-binding protein YcdF (DUF218 family)
MLLISKIFGTLAYPVGLSCLFMCIAIGLTIAHKKKGAFLCAFASIFIIVVFGCPMVSWYLVRSLEKKYSPQSPLPNKASAIVLLGGFTRPAIPPRQYIEIGCGGDRLLHAVRLYKEKKASVIICTGGKIPFLLDFPGSEAACMANLLKEFWGIDSSSIIVEDKAQNTHDHALRVAAVLKQHGLKKDIILVTSAFHMFRTMKIFKKYDFTVFPAPSGFFEESSIKFSLFSMLPTIEALYESTVALHEFYGILAYWVFGWI